MIKLELLKIKIQSRFRYNLFVGLASISVIGVNIFDLITQSNDVAWSIFSYILITGAALLLAFNVHFIRTSLKDLNALKNKKYETVNAKFLSFSSKNVSKKYTSKVVYSGQKFRDLSNDKIIDLEVDDVELKELYVIAYGKHSKIGVVIQKYNIK